MVSNFALSDLEQNTIPRIFIVFIIGHISAGFSTVAFR